MKNYFDLIFCLQDSVVLSTMTSVECVLEVMEQPAERVKFRTEVKSFYCGIRFQNDKLLADSIEML